MTKLTDLHTKEFLALLASDAPAPGGGGAAAMAGALAAALASMQANLTIGKKNFVEQQAEAELLLLQAENSRSKLLELAEDDAAVFSEFMRCYRLPKSNEEEQFLRSQSICRAAKRAAEIPLEIARESLRVMRLALRMAQIGNPHVITDGAVSGLLARAALRGSIYNIMVNLRLTQDEAYNMTLCQESNLLEQQAEKLEQEILALTDKVIGR